MDVLNKMYSYLDPISIDDSIADSRSLIMPHQQEAVDALNSYFDMTGDFDAQNGLIAMPTGSGKTYTAVNWLLSSGITNNFKVVWLSHRQELIEQSHNEFRKQVPILKNSGIKKLTIIPVSGMHFKMSMASRGDIYVCSIASVANKYGYRFIRRMVGEQGKKRLIIIIDEAHHAVSPQYQKVIKRLTELNPKRLLIGLTATPTRMQDGEKRKLAEMFNVYRNLESNSGTNKGYIYEVTLKQLLITGFLANPIYEKVETNINGEIAYDFTPEDEIYFERFGELSEGIMGQIARSSARNEIIVDQYLKNKERYGKTLIFAVNQMHAETLCNEFKEKGINCDYAVSDKTGSQQTIYDFKMNKFDVLINVQMLTEGSDVPDIQTVFLTRETNSDSLLMQMIGRGLRGEKAGGTRDAYIVDFHDKWEKYAFWLDPGKLDIFVPDPPTDPKDLTAPKDPTAPIDPLNVDLHDLYLKIYHFLRVSMTSAIKSTIIPYGWYAIVDDEGNNSKLLVYYEQLKSYERIEKNKEKLIMKQVNGETVLKIFFKDTIKPLTNELNDFLDLIYATEEMPLFYTFEQRTLVEPSLIAKKMNSLFVKYEDKENWLKEYFDSTQIVKEIYKYFIAFKKTVFDSEIGVKEADIKTIDERKDYHIIEGTHDLEALYNQTLIEHPDLNDEGLLDVYWSEKVEKAWFGVCIKYENEENGNSYCIGINKLLDSPDVDKELIKYLLYHELLHKNGYWEHDAKFRDKEWMYENSDEWDGFLDEMIYRYKLEIPLSDKRNKKKPTDEDVINLPSGNEGNIDVKIKVESFDKNAMGVEQGVKYCRNCGNKLPVEAKFCDKCGNNLSY